MKNKKPIWIMKLGGSVVTDKYSITPRINDNLSEISEEIRTGYNSDNYSMILVHGAGSYAHSLVKETEIYKGIKDKKQIKSFAKTERLCRELNSIIVKHLEDVNMQVFPLQISSSVIMNKGKIENMETGVISGLLENDIVPVLYGEPAYDRNQVCSILSSDQIASYLAKTLKAERILYATNVDGVFTGDPNKNRKAKLIPLINSDNLGEMKRYLSCSDAHDITGGMKNKIEELIDIKKFSVTSQIFNGLKEGNIKKALEGCEFGTIINIVD